MVKHVIRMGQADAAYIAGLSRRHRNENRHLVVSISNTDRPLLDYVLSAVGAGKITGKRTSQSHHRPYTCRLPTLDKFSQANSGNDGRRDEPYHERVRGAGAD